jgi:hypothetical protein
MQPLERGGTAAFGLIFGALGHAVGWPFVEGGTQRLVDALVDAFESEGGEIITGRRVASLSEWPHAKLVLLDVAPPHAARIAGDELPASFRSRLEQCARGPAAFKMDWLLDGRIPWRARECDRAGMVHVCGTLDEVRAAEHAVWSSSIPARPFVLVAQPSLFDRSRGAGGKHVVWAYCHVPNGCDVDMTESIERQIERFAPGFRDRILVRRATSPADLERYDENYLGGDIGGGSNGVPRMFLRPVARWSPHTTPAHLPVLELDAPGSGRSRHVRMVRRAGGALARVRAQARVPRRSRAERDRHVAPTRRAGAGRDGRRVSSPVTARYRRGRCSRARGFVTVPRVVDPNDPDSAAVPLERRRSSGRRTSIAERDVPGRAWPGTCRPSTRAFAAR